MELAKSLSRYVNLIFNSKYTVSLDIGHRYTKALQLSLAEQGEIHLKKLAFDRTPTDMFTQQGIDEAIASEFIVSLLAENHIKAGTVLFTLGKPHVLVKIIPLTSVDESKVDIIIREKLKDIVSSASDVIYDYQVIKVDDTSSVAVVVTVRKELVESVKSTAEKSMLIVGSLEADILSALNIFILTEKPQMGKKYVVVHGGFSYSDVVIMNGHVPIYHQTINLGAMDIVNMSGKEFNMDEVESALDGQSASPEVADMIRDGLELIIRRALNNVADYADNYGDEISMSELHFMGSIGRMAQVVKMINYIDEFSGKEVKIKVPESFKVTDKIVDDSQTYLQSIYSACMGTALRNIVERLNG